MLRVEIRSDLDVPTEADILDLRVTELNALQPVAVESYDLTQVQPQGWPQIIPVVRGTTYRQHVSIEAEVRLRGYAPAPVTVGYGEVEAEFLASGEREVVLPVTRACSDNDGDGYGIGLGCGLTDCDDANPLAPKPYFEQCPGLGGQGSDASPDAALGVDADGSVALGDDGGEDALDAGGASDAGVSRGDAESTLDSGAGDSDASAADASAVACGSITCLEGEVCLSSGSCKGACSVNADCGGPEHYCLIPPGACLCRFCRGDAECGGGTLVCVRSCCVFE